MVTQTNAQLCYTLTRFLGVVVHTLLHHRECYPARSFMLARAYDHPVRQSRHPVLCAWIEDAIDAVHTELLSGTLARAALVICDARTGAPLERFVFDFGQLPKIAAEDANTLFVREGQTVDLEDDDGETAPVPPEQLDLSESLRAVLSKLSSLGGRLDPIPPGCSFTIAVELKDEADIAALNGREHDDGSPYYEESFLPAEKDLASESALEVSDFKPDDTRRTQPWILARPGQFKRQSQRSEQVRTVPIRSVDAGELVFEMWADERLAAKKAAREAPAVVKQKVDTDKGKEKVPTATEALTKATEEQLPAEKTSGESKDQPSSNGGKRVRFAEGNND